jgi:hypothetical protein
MKAMKEVCFTVFAALVVAAYGTATFAADPEEVEPAPAAIGADVPVTYFGPAPSSAQRSLVGPHQELKSGKVDTEKGTITLPLYEGAMQNGQTVWYIITDTDDKGNADCNVDRI